MIAFDFNTPTSRTTTLLCRALAIVTLCFVASCGQKVAPAANVDSAPRKVQTVKADRRPMERVLTVTGSFLAREKSTLSVKVAGRLESMTVDIGSVVKRGDVLAQIERKDYELKLQQAEATLLQARARLGLPAEGDDDSIDPAKTPVMQQATAVLEEARKNRNRVEALSKEKIASQADLDAAQSSFNVAQGKYDEALQDVRERQALLRQRRAELNIARKQVDDSTIVAPFDGIVQERRASPGEFLESGTALLAVANIDPLRLHLEVPERESARVKPGQRVEIAVGGSTNTYIATLNRVSPMLSESNRMLVVEADVPATASLRPGLFVQASIVVDTNDPALLVPSAAVTSFVGLEKAFVVKDGKAIEKSIVTGRRKGDEVEVVSGLAPGDVVILSPGKLRTGEAVTQEVYAEAR